MNALYALAAASVFCNLLGFWIITSQYNELRRLRRRQRRLEDRVIHYVQLVDELKHIAEEEEDYAQSTLEDEERDPVRPGHVWIRGVRKTDQ